MNKAGLTRIAISAAVVLFAIAGIALAGRYLRARERMQTLETLSLRAGCDKKQEVKLHLVPLQSMEIKTPVYGIDNTGALFRLNLPEANRSIISRHAFYPNRSEFDFGVVIRQSTDGRWISYSHELGNSDILQYWLYDTRQNTDRMAFQAEAGLSGQASFSPDGSMLATALGVEAGVRKNDAGVYLIDTATLNRTRIPLPTKHPLNEVTFAPRWSADGKELLIELEVDKAKHEKNEYYSWHVADKRAEKIDGDGSNYDNLRFLRQGAAISLAEDLEPQSENWATESVSASGNWHARLRQPDEQGKLSLEIKGKAGATETAFSVFSVPFTACDAPQIDAPVISGWLDERHLVFSDSPPGAFYVFDTATGTIALLFDGVEDTRQFWWRAISSNEKTLANSRKGNSGLPTSIHQNSTMP